MPFTASTYQNLVSEPTSSQSRLFATYLGTRDDFDLIIVGSGFGGGVLADDVAERIGDHKRILLLEAGSYLYPTHVYNMCRFGNASVAKHFACKTFEQGGDERAEEYIHERPQLNFGGRSIFWSGLIPSIQPWELDFFPDRVRAELERGLLAKAGANMNESVSMGSTAKAIVAKLRQTALNQDFIIEETPRALHQPYLTPQGMLQDQLFMEPTGVFNTAELLINQVGLTPGVRHGDGPGLHVILNSFVEKVESIDGFTYRVETTNTLNGQTKSFFTKAVVIAGGSIESPKLLRRSPSVFNNLSPAARGMVGVGLTDHPTTDELSTTVSNIANIPIPPTSHAKIIFYSRCRRNPANPSEILYPFNIEMNINHEYWHLRENDPSETHPIRTAGDTSRIDIKFSFANPIYGGNHMELSEHDNYVPRMHFQNNSWTSHLAGSRFPALANWHHTDTEIFAILNNISHQIFSQFQLHGQPARPHNEVWYGQNNKGFGLGTVHHAACSLRMPFKGTRDMPFEAESVVDEDLKVRGERAVFVCDMSVMPISTAANPVRTSLLWR